ncbi:helix-turn-helix domain-containing protein [Streptosporangium sp. NBC_01639]|uniref:helix-turn-helix domain-containing protein n=1 Tax=Streptosporangium sp. NBC_01639 TaxID=2975948 RepID=UPI003866F2EB|nr:helix-turn-helix domain-containing protein [Streptosporangium sp. NBC_01639]
MHPRETVDRALRLSALGLVDREVAQLCGVSLGAVQKWRTRTRRTSENEDIRRHRSCPRCHNRALDLEAYAYLLGLYLGDGHILLCKKDVYQLSLACCNTWPGLLEAAAETMAVVMPTSSVSRRRFSGCTEVKSYSKHWACLFPQHGPGRKHEREITLEQWQREIIEEHPGRFARGLIHSDGYRGTNRVRRHSNGSNRWYEYPRYLFANESRDILRLCGETLDLLGVAWRHSKPNTISVAKREAVERLDMFVGPKY